MLLHTRQPQGEHHPKGGPPSTRHHLGESVLRPPAKPNRHFYHPLDALLGTPAGVRILRMLCLDPSSRSPMHIAARCSLGRPGTREALLRLLAAGIIERSGGWPRFPHYRLAAAHPLAGLLRRLFEDEAVTRQPRGWGLHLSTSTESPG